MKIDVAPCKSAPWFVEFRFGFNRAIIDDLKRLPGCRWDPDKRCWLVPIELYDWMRQGRIKLGEKEHGKRERAGEEADSPVEDASIGGGGGPGQ